MTDFQNLPDSLNETIDLHESRLVAGIDARVPETLLLLLQEHVLPGAKAGVIRTDR